MMDYSYSIRKAVVADASDIRKVLQESFAKYIKDAGISGTVDALEETEADIRKDILTKEVFIAFIDDSPVGTIRVELLPDNSAYITRFGVINAYQGSGIGNSLLGLVNKFLISKGVRKAFLYTASKYSDLVRFYYGRGFYIESVSSDRGYLRARMVRDFV